MMTITSSGIYNMPMIEQMKSQIAFLYLMCLSLLVCIALLTYLSYTQNKNILNLLELIKLIDKRSKK